VPELPCTHTNSLAQASIQHGGCSLKRHLSMCLWYKTHTSKKQREHLTTLRCTSARRTVQPLVTGGAVQGWVGVSALCTDACPVRPLQL
jgi:hypothetical protein